MGMDPGEVQSWITENPLHLKHEPVPKNKIRGIQQDFEAPNAP